MCMCVCLRVSACVLVNLGASECIVESACVHSVCVGVCACVCVYV